jgi:hypothetical protein
MASPTEILSPPTMYVYFLYANFGLLCVAITVGVVILLRRQSTKDQMTGVGEIDYPKIASQLQREILRLQELRDRIYPEGAADIAIQEVSGQVSGAAQAVAITTMSNEELKELPEVQKLLNTEINELTKKHAEAITILEAQTGGVDPALVSKKEAVEKENASLKTEIEELKAKIAAAPASEIGIDSEKLELEVKELKERLNEYEIFEDDLSRVKELTRENEELKKQLSGMGPSSAVQNPKPVEQVAPSIPEIVAEPEAAPSPQASDAALTSGSTDAPVEEPVEVDEGAVEAAIESETAKKLSSAPEESDETSVDNVTAEFEKLLSGSAPEGEEVPKGFEAEKVTEEPNISAEPSKETQASIGEDDLMAEFEKLLGSVDKES